MKFVITGPTGAIGMALIQKCIKNQNHALVISHKGSKRIQNIRNLVQHNKFVKIIEADLQDIPCIAEQINEQYDVFYHLAWMGTTGVARNDMYLQNQNIKYTLDAVNLAYKLGCRIFIGAGSQAEYGRVEGRITPATPAFPENGYGMAKLCAGQMSRQMCEELGMKHIWIRILSVYGPYDGETSMISSTLKTLISGGHAGFTPGEQMWDYLYSEDAAKALYLIAEKGTAGKIYVLGSGQAKPLKEYILEIYQAVREVNPHAGSIGIGDFDYAHRQVMHLKADITELTTDTGFLPEVAFREGIRKTIKLTQFVN